jgi:3-deoxy-7-phosphoheptulonate synthase
VEYFRGIRNPVGVKVGAAIAPEELLRLLDTLNPHNEQGKIVLIARMGAKKVGGALPGLVEVVQRAGKHVLWVCDPMHGNIMTTSGGIKTREFEQIAAELETSWDVHESLGSHLGGVHIELTGEDVTECTGGAQAIADHALSLRYHTACDPRLNASQALELAFLIAEKLKQERTGRDQARRSAAAE